MDHRFLLATILARLLLTVFAGGVTFNAAFGQIDDDAERQRVSRLVAMLGSEKYQERVDAELQLRDIGDRLPKLLTGIAEPTGVERLMRLRRVLRFVESRGLVENRWILSTWPLKGEQLDIRERQEIRFFEDGSFSHPGNSNAKPEKWELDLKANRLRMSFNGGYAIYTGTFNDRGEVVGRAKNTRDKQWHFRLTPDGSASAGDGGR